jgi:predicted dehydrogenase
VTGGNLLRVGIIGCGKIADAHAAQIARIPGCEIVGVCDSELLMARQLADRFTVGEFFNDVEALIADSRPQVVHITTPPESHFGLARLCLERGCHVYVEKPFTLDSRDAEILVELAEDSRLKLTAGHDDQFSHVARRMRRLVRSGYLGGAPVHIESTYGYDFTDGYAKAVLGDRNHWARRLPGKLLHNIISHGIARIAEFMTSDRPHVMAHGFVSPRIKQLGETEIIDELRVMIDDDERTTAYFTFSSQVRPVMHELRLCGSKNSLVLDQDQETLIKVRGSRYKSYGEKFVPPVAIAGQHLRNLATNARTFLHRDFHMKSGMKHLIESFYRSIVDGEPVPIPYKEIVRTARIMDDIFDQIGRNHEAGSQREREVGRRAFDRSERPSPRVDGRMDQDGVGPRRRLA